MRTIILLLGSPNDNKGLLSKIAIDRINCANSLYQNNDNTSILCTGGYGEHFNVTNQPHAYYAKQELRQKGVEEEAFLPFAESSNTYEDFEKSKTILEKEIHDLLIVVTSDFHMRRAKIICERILKRPNVIYVSATSSLPESELLGLAEHEKNAIQRLESYAKQNLSNT